MTTTIAIVLPLFAGYTAAILKYYVNNPASPTEPGKPIAGPLVVTSIAFPSALALVVLGSTVGLWQKSFDKFELFGELFPGASSPPVGEPPAPLSTPHARRAVAG